MLLNILSFVSIFTSIWGLIALSDNPTVTIICAIIALINCIATVICTTEKGMKAEVIAVVVGIIVAVTNDMPWYLGAATGLCLASAVMGILGILWIVFCLITSRRN